MSVSLNWLVLFSIIMYFRQSLVTSSSVVWAKPVVVDPVAIGTAFADHTDPSGDAWFHHQCPVCPGLSSNTLSILNVLIGMIALLWRCRRKAWRRHLIHREAYGPVLRGPAIQSTPEPKRVNCERKRSVWGHWFLVIQDGFNGTFMRKFWCVDSA